MFEKVTMSAAGYLRKRVQQGSSKSGGGRVPSYGEIADALRTGQFTDQYNPNSDPFKVGVKALRERGVNHPNDRVDVEVYTGGESYDPAYQPGDVFLAD